MFLNINERDNIGCSLTPDFCHINSRFSGRIDDWRKDHSSCLSNGVSQTKKMVFYGKVIIKRLIMEGLSLVKRVKMQMKIC